MKFQKFLAYFLLISLALWTVSCSEDTDSDELAEVDAFGEARRGGGNRGGGNGGGGNGGNGGNGGTENNQTLPGELSNDVLEEWTDFLIEIERYATGMRPNASARAFAYIYLAAYETAVPGMENYVSNMEYLDGLNIDQGLAEGDINYEVALNQAFSEVIDHFIINISRELDRSIDDFQITLARELEDGLSNRVIENSEEWGEHVAERVIRYAQSDREAEEQITEPQPLSYEPPVGEGFWTYSADPERGLFPYWGSVRTFVISSDETSSVPPVPYSELPSSNYFQQMMEVYNVNNEAKAQQGEDLHIAEFWSDDVEGLMMSPPARQLSIANQLIDQYGLNLDASLELFVKLGFSLNDAAVSTWADKYEYMVMRPSNYIHEFIDPDFQTNLYRLVYWPNPSFPGYPSGHSTFASAAAGVFIDVFGNATQFTDLTHEGRTEFLGSPRTFTTFEQMAEENAFSRIPLGVHIRMDCSEGIRLGYEIADAVNGLELSTQ